MEVRSLVGRRITWSENRLLRSKGKRKEGRKSVLKAQRPPHWRKKGERGVTISHSTALLATLAVRQQPAFARAAAARKITMAALYLSLSLSFSVYGSIRGVMIPDLDPDPRRICQSQSVR